MLSTQSQCCVPSSLWSPAAALLRALPVAAGDEHFGWVADAIAKASGVPDAPDPVVVTEGYEHAYVSEEAGALVIHVDIAL